ncbi:MAG: phosphoribosyl-AMP cyclohydrolase [Clostridia bacterium]|nr:phosphoribosyl-AMP cyclohydrolase [Clostridia bacterium]
MSWEDKIFCGRELVPAIITDCENGEVLMLAYMNRESFKKTLETGKTWFFSRSRNTLWNKGETSGHWQYVKSVKSDCDNDTLLISVKQIGPACHTGARSCFFNIITEGK